MNEKDPEQSSAKIAALLQNGAHALIVDEGNTKASEDFANADINDILAQRTEKRQIGSRAGNTFSTAQFAVDNSPAVSLLNPIKQSQIMLPYISVFTVYTFVYTLFIIYHILFIFSLYIYLKLDLYCCDSSGLSDNVQSSNDRKATSLFWS